ncbi:MAG: hypothetical protein KJO75_05925 [Dactylosporangium sp.]|nr:hypothetical protein [Dactylosporangium sp.]
MASPCNHNARTIAALAANPGCDRRAVLDTAGIDKRRLVAHLGLPARFGQSRFAITRGNAFEAQLKADACTGLLGLVAERLELTVGDASYENLGGTGEGQQEDRTARARAALVRAAGESRRAVLLDHPLLTLDVAGRPVHLEPDLVAGLVADRLHIIEIKSFAVIDGQADAAKVAAAAIQAAVYALALRQTLERAGADPELVAHDVVLICPRDFTNQPVATLIDVRKQLAVLRRQLARMTRFETLLARLPADLTFDLAIDDGGTATRPPDEVVAALETVPARYVPECLSTCELATFCRDRARATTGCLGRGVREQLGGIDGVADVAGLAAGTRLPAAGQTEAGELLRAAGRLRAEVLGTLA